jgi:putative oxidoreductase
MCGFFFIPHTIGKITAREAAFGFFRAAGFRPVAAFAYTAMVIELILACTLISGYFVRPAAWFACAYLLIGAAAVIKVEKKWLWHIGGCEYPFFWGLCCALVAVTS